MSGEIIMPSSCKGVIQKPNDMKKILFNYQVNLNTGARDLYVGEVDLQYKHCKSTNRVSGSIYADNASQASVKLKKRFINLLK